MSDDYQVRKDIDRLQSTMYETGSDQLKLATKEELEAYQDEVDKRFYDVGQIDETVEEANNLIDKAKKDLNDFKIEAQNALDGLTDDKVEVSDFEKYQGQVTTALSGKSDEGHIHPISDVTSLQTTLDGKAPKNHSSTATTYGVSTATYYGHSKASNSTPSADTVNGSSGTVNGIYANANHTHPLSSIYAQASHQHDASDVLYTIKDDLLWSLINTTIDKNLNGETLTGIYSLVNTEFNLSTAQSTSHTNNKYYIVYANTTTDVTSAISTGIDVSADIEDKYIKEMLDTKRNTSDVISASEVDVISNWGGNRHQQAQTVFESIWRAINSGIGGNGSRVFVAEAEWNSTNSVFELSSDSIPTTDWQKGDMLIIPLFKNVPDTSPYFVANNTFNSFYINEIEHYITNYYGGVQGDKLFNNHLKLMVHEDAILILVCDYSQEANDGDGWDISWTLVYNSIFDELMNDYIVVSSFNSSLATDRNVASAYGVKQINDKIEQVSTITTITLNSYATLYVNEATHNCELYYTRSFANATANTKYTWHSNLIDEKYRPPYEVFGLFEPYGYLYVDTNGTVSGKFPNGFSTRTTTYGRVRWSY